MFKSNLPSFLSCSSFPDGFPTPAPIAVDIKAKILPLIDPGVKGPKHRLHNDLSLIPKTINLFKSELPDRTIHVFCHLWDSSHIKTGENKFNIELYDCVSGGVFPKTDIIPFLRDYKREHLAEQTMTSNKPCYGQFYSMGKCQKFRMEYEKQYNISYYLVFRIRTDIRFNSLPEINKIYKII